MGKGKGTSTEQSQEIDPTMRLEAQKTSDLASMKAAMGYEPYKGHTTAAFSGQQEDSFRAAGQAADAFGMGNSVGTGQSSTDVEGGSKGGRGGGGTQLDEFGMPVATADPNSGILGYSAFDSAGGENMAGDKQGALDEFYRAAGTPVTPQAPLKAGGGGKK